MKKMTDLNNTGSTSGETAEAVFSSEFPAWARLFKWFALAIQTAAGADAAAAPTSRAKRGWLWRSRAAGSTKSTWLWMR